MATLVAKEYKRFEDIKHIREDGSEFWSARELAPALDYIKWENFSKVIKRAMITGKDIKEIIQTMKTDGPTSIGQLIEALDYYKINHAERNTRISKKNPVPYKYSILTVHTDAGYTHWTLLCDGKYYDPEFGLIEGEYTYGKITSFLGIYT